MMYSTLANATGTPEALGKFIAAEVDAIGAIVRQVGAKID